MVYNLSAGAGVSSRSAPKKNPIFEGLSTFFDRDGAIPEASYPTFEKDIPASMNEWYQRGLAVGRSRAEPASLEAHWYSPSVGLNNNQHGRLEQEYLRGLQEGYNPKTAIQQAQATPRNIEIQPTVTVPTQAAPADTGMPDYSGLSFRQAFAKALATGGEGSQFMWTNKDGKKVPILVKLNRGQKAAPATQVAATPPPVQPVTHVEQPAVPAQVEPSLGQVYAQETRPRALGYGYGGGMPSGLGNPVIADRVRRAKELREAAAASSGM